MKPGFVPQEMFFTAGVGRHVDKLASFEEALRDAKIAPYNLVPVSSIYPPHCEVVKRAKGLKNLAHGEVVFCVMSRSETNVKGHTISAAVGAAIPDEKEQHGYLAEVHDRGSTAKEAGMHADVLAVDMLAGVWGKGYAKGAKLDPKTGLWKVGKHKIETQNAARLAKGQDGLWTTVIACSIFCK